jgi:phenylpyruvate tautomerase PptA (4-oxalocrotonate tautomerase family)
MALARINILEGRTPNRRAELMEAVHEALVVALEVPRGDPTLCVIEHDPGSVSLPSFPHQTGDDWALVEITMFSGRSPQAKQRLYEEIVRRLGVLGVPAMDVTIVVIESDRENWGVRGGVPASEVDLGFEVNV